MKGDKLLINVGEDGNEVFSPDWHINESGKEHCRIMCCPICGFENTHFNDKLKVVENVDREYCNDWIGEGQNILIPFTCEMGHRFELIINEHKGYVRFSFVNGAQDSTDEDRILSGYCKGCDEPYYIGGNIDKEEEPSESEKEGIRIMRILRKAQAQEELKND
ncbi:MAG TPA: hypothetical protein DCM31_06575 [Deferribacteraceae bacterium]|nr:hypothetical protein [Deferribacteraceae bacterium]